jgi:RecJ-like exonuclease
MGIGRFGIQLETGPDAATLLRMAETAQRPGWVRRTLRRLLADPHELDAEDLQGHVGRTGAKPVARCGQGEPVTVAGRLRSVVYTPKNTVPTVDAELYDGSGSVHLVWLGRRRIPGVEPGRVVVARGRVAERDGSLVIYNPWYELRPVGA